MVLGVAKAKFQGLDVGLDLIIDEESAKLIDETMLNNIVDGKSIKIGNEYIDDNYERNKKLYIDRRVKPKAEFDFANRIRPQTLYDLDDDVVLLTAVPGMGKSTLMTYLSLKTKEINPKVWILRINLLEHTKMLSDWKDSQTDINMLESLRFMCDVAICKDHRDFNEDDEFKIDLEEVLGTVILKNWTEDSFIEFQLKLFLYYYNTQKLIFIFDGFDEIFPDYADQALALVKSVRDFTKRHKIWITSRSYNNIKSILETEFGPSYGIDHFSWMEQDKYLFLYWQNKLQLSKLSSEQLQNINDFIQFITKKSNGVAVFNNIRHKAYFKVYTTFLLFLKQQSTITGLDIPCLDEYYELEIDSKTHEVIEFNKILSSPPLHLYLLAEYTVNKIKYVDDKQNKWDINITEYIMCEYYMEINLKRIMFQEKNKIDVYKPDNRVLYEKERTEYVNKYKKLGAFVVFYPNTEYFNDAELNEINKMIDELKDGREKSGLIRTVVNNVPIFIHMSFAEYLAVEYICDRLKSQVTKEGQEKMWEFIIKVLFRRSGTDCFQLFNIKFKMDSQLIEMAESNKLFIFQLLSDNQSDYQRNDKINGIDGCSGLLGDEQINENNVVDFEKLYKVPFSTRKDYLVVYPGTDVARHRIELDDSRRLTHDEIMKLLYAFN